MTIRDTYAFPMYHRMWEAARPALAARGWIVIVLLVVLLIYLPLLFSGYLLDDYILRLHFSPRAYARLGLPPSADPREPALMLYSFTSVGALSDALDKGLIPWWISEHIQTNFFRPLSSLTLALDFSLWPDNPLLSHIHSLLWYGLLVALAHRLYRAMSGSAALAGLSIFLFAVDDVAAYPVGWISNRHALIGMVFCVLTLLLFHRAQQSGHRPWLAAAAGAYAAALLASEMGVVTLVYLFAYLLVLSVQKWPARLMASLPFVLITGVWWAAYSGLGFGTRGNLLYIDPVHGPLAFGAQLLVRYPTYLFSIGGVPVAGKLLIASPQASAWIAAGCTLLLGVLAWSLRLLLRSDRTSAFWIVGVLLAAVLLTAGVPGQRNLGLVSLGMMALIGSLLARIADMRRSAALAAHRLRWLQALIPGVLIAHVIVPIYSVIAAPGPIRAGREWNDRLVDFGDEAVLSKQHVYVINPPGTLFYLYGLMQRAFSAAPLPASINFLSSGFMPVHIQRLDEQTIIVTPEHGYSLRPGPIIDYETGAVTHFGDENAMRWVESIYYNPEVPAHAEQEIVLSEVSIKITRMNSDGRIAQAAFAFAHQLEDSRYVWLLWDAAGSTYVRVRMPPVGESKVYSTYGAYLCAALGCQ